jgi:hypothetical protein
MKYPDVERIRKVIEWNLSEIASNRPDLIYALLGTGFFKEHIGNYNEWKRILNRRDYFKYLSTLKLWVFKIKPFGG